jgi:hypothetical protein
MAKVGNYYHGSIVTQNVASIGTSFDKTKYHLHDLFRAEGINTSGRFLNKVESVYVRVTNIVGGSATPTLTMRISLDADGDYTFFPDTAGQIAVGLTTTTSGVAVYEFKLPVVHFFGSSDFYLFVKIDQGTCTLANSAIMWSE